ncbi:MAG TPA: T9SS type A sorting domain-containing protein [Bacteroidales bacterium]|nr:T9SS type A sorting domain-containing protein [Bacteroidales bacterium]
MIIIALIIVIYNISFTETEPAVNFNYSIYRIDENNLYQICKQDAFNSENPEISTEVSPLFPDYIIITNLVNSNESVTNTSKINLAPNPFEDFTVLSFESLQEEIDIKITDINGKLIFEDRYTYASELKINLTRISTGLYTLSYICEEMQDSINLVIE